MNKEETAKLILTRLRSAGHTALWAGGCVRDRLMGREPKDYDVATSAHPEAVQKLFARTEAVGAQFGVILIIEEGTAFEVATFRTEGPYLDGRRPESVAFSSPQEDASRRDFTVNGLFLDPFTGEVSDYVGGREDIARKVIRCIGDPGQRFAEDKLRMLRALRFSAELGFEIEPATFAALKGMASHAVDVAWERNAVELTKMFVCPGRRRGLELLDQAGLLPVLLPELVPTQGCDQPPQFHPEGDVWVHTLMALEKLQDPGPELAWATLLHDVGKPPTRTQAPGDRIRFNRHDSVGAEMAASVCRRFKMSAGMTERVSTLVADHLRLDQVEEMKVSTLKRLFRLDHFGQLLALHKADCQASHGHMEIYDFCLKKMAEFEALGGEEQLKPKPLLDGHDLMAMGFTPGPRFKEILEAVESEQLEGRLDDKEGAAAFVRERFKTGETGAMPQA